MGHIVNPTSMRLGWFRGWTDTWFTDKSYYAEYFHSVLKIRLFLTFFFAKRSLERLGYFYSHFHIQNSSNLLKIDVFLYDGSLEGFIESTLFFQFLNLKGLNKRDKNDNTKRLQELKKAVLPRFYIERPLYRKLFRRFPQRFSKLSKKKFRYTSADLLMQWSVAILFNLFAPLKASYSSSEFRNPFKKALYSKSFKQMSLAFMDSEDFSGLRYKDTYDSEFVHDRVEFLFLYSLYHKVKSYWEKSNPYNNKSLEILLTRFYYMFAWRAWNGALFHFFSDFLGFIINSITNLNSPQINFFALDRFTINARFLARYIARKLKQNVRVWELLNPIRKELNKARFMSAPSPRKNLEKLLGVRATKVQMYRASFYRRVLSILLSLKKKENHLSFKNNSSILSAKDLICKRLFTEEAILHATSVEKLFYLIFTYESKKNHFDLFSNAKISTLSDFLFPKDRENTLVASIKEAPLIRLVVDSNFSTLNSLLDIENAGFSTCRRILFTGSVLSRFLRFGFWKSLHNQVFLPNRKTIWSRYSAPDMFLLGFKFQCVGRFSRKQRSSDSWFRETKIPLNTLNASIDYGFCSMPLRNSSAGIKVWLYKTTSSDDFYFRIS